MISKLPPFLKPMMYGMPLKILGMNAIFHMLVLLNATQIKITSHGNANSSRYSNSVNEVLSKDYKSICRLLLFEQCQYLLGIIACISLYSVSTMSYRSIISDDYSSNTVKKIGLFQINIILGAQSPT